MHLNEPVVIFLIFISVLLINVSGDDDGPEVNIKDGTLRGKYWKTRGGRRFSAFLAIPYAKPPVGDLRFKEPQSPDGWEGVRDASKDSNICWQRNVYVRSDDIIGDEDCLYLNVYTPQLPSMGSEPLPVMVFFHGGGWLCGGGTSQWYGPDILLDREVVLVVPNYRLGPLGFLSTGDEVVPGNNGLKDQSMVLKWINENIVKFGGDPSSVTMFGESAGGASAHFHTLSPLSKGLFKNAISQSGTGFAIWALSRHDETLNSSRKLAEFLNCPSAPSDEMIDCLRKVDAQEIIAQDRKFFEWDYDPMITFKPVIEPKWVENAFLIEDPEISYKSGRGTNVPWIIGMNSGEGALKVSGFYGKLNLVEEFDKDFNKLAPLTMLYHNESPEVIETTNKLIRQYYFGDKTIDKNAKSKLIDLFTDSWFLDNMDYANKIHRKYSSSPLYNYIFTHKGVASFSEVFGDPNDDYGVCHVDECLYLFPITDGLFKGRKPDELDKIMAEIMTTLWVNFAKTSTPTPETNEVVPVEWKPAHSTINIEYYQIGPNLKLAMKKGLYKERAKFWRSLPFTRKEITLAHSEL